MMMDPNTDNIHNHPTVQQLLRWQRRHQLIIVVLALALGLLAGFVIRDYSFVPRSVL
jgi:hypothetical protein